ncbi:very short patch repair endonuclease [Duganella sp. HH101]|uniref:very short patch repair endonuclease n=1 Tax=Duganella sp. HH101 TaxID=1781066 RepID=UPI0008FCB290|nr:very short patch repair endonuclease [Duganella sp. HH101]
MTDSISPERRSRNMAAIRSINTKPELMLRKALHAAGFRFRLHRKDLPGRPDIVLPRYNTVIFVNGCFWHQHPGCKFARNPQSHEAFWKAKLDRNVERDKCNTAELDDLGWKVIVVWECELRDSTDFLASLVNLIRNEIPKPSHPSTSVQLFS